MPYVDQVLLDVLRCPACRSEVDYKDRRRVVVCQGCGLQYPVVDGIPVMLEDEAKPSHRR